MPFFVVAVVIAVAWLLHRELRHYDYAAVARGLRAIPVEKIAWGIALTILSYAILVGYDALALRQLGRSPGLARTAFASFTAYVLSYNVGLAVISGTAVRFRLYSAWNYTRAEIARIVVFTSATFWVGLFFAAGALLVAWRAPAWPAAPWLSAHLRLVGLALLVVVAAYLVVCATRRTPLTLGSWSVPLPRWPTALGQVFLGAVDVIVAGLVCWVVLPAGWPLEQFLSVYLLGMTLGLLSHVPGGLGVLETVLLYGRPADLAGPDVLGAILIYRAIYYLGPLALALGLFATHEVIRQRPKLQRLGLFSGRWADRLAPPLFAATAFLAGVVLLFSGATPAVHDRLRWLHALLPLPILEASHLLGSVVGVLLLFVARGLQRRLDGAFVLAVGLLGAGAAFSLLKGADWEEAFILLAILGVMLPCHRFFDRRASLLEARFAAGWIAAISAALLATLWLGFFAFRHVEYRHELWWHFALRGDAPRFLRASVAALAVAAAIGVRHLLRPAVAQPPEATPGDLERAAAIVAASGDLTGQLALVGDKFLFFSASGRSFLMYGVEGRSWIAMGDPIGPREEWEDLVWTFREESDRHGARVAFYEVGAEGLPLYLDLGLTLTKLGEEAHVPLRDFSLEQPEFKGLRQTLRRMESEGVTFAWIETADVPAHLAELRDVSNSWLAAKSLREKGFSVGFFSDDYLRRNPVVVARRAGEILAFANVWRTPQDLSIDLMRYRESAPPRVMEFLLTELMLRGARMGCERFNLGMAPMSGMETHPLAPWRRRVGALVYQHGERFYHFQGLRAFKEKYRPTWLPRYLASPGGLALPVVLANVTSLISRGPKTRPSP